MRHWIAIAQCLFEDEYHFPMKMAVLLADEIGASEEMLTPGSAIDWQDGFGAMGAILTMPNGNRIFIDATIDNKTIYLSQIAVENKSQGVGMMVMDAIKTIADRYKYSIYVYKVVNPAFFNRIHWLTKKDKGTFVYHQPATR